MVWVGASVGRTLSPDLMGLLLGCGIIGFIVSEATRNPDTPRKPLSPVAEKIWALGWGFISGLLLAGGPVLVSLLQRENIQKESFIGTIQVLFLGSGIIKVIRYWGVESPLKENPWFIVGMVIIPVFGAWAGKKLLRYVSVRQFRFGVQILLLGAGLRLIMSSI